MNEYRGLGEKGKRLEKEMLRGHTNRLAGLQKKVSPSVRVSLISRNKLCKIASFGSTSALNVAKRLAVLNDGWGS